MNLLTIIFTSLVALEHLYIMYLETFATSSKRTSHTFGMSQETLKEKNVSTLFKNQGIYNGLLALLIVIALGTQDLFWDVLY